MSSPFEHLMRSIESGAAASTHNLPPDILVAELREHARLLTLPRDWTWGDIVQWRSPRFAHLRHASTDNLMIALRPLDPPQTGSEVGTVSSVLTYDTVIGFIDSDGDFLQIGTVGAFLRKWEGEGAEGESTT